MTMMQEQLKPMDPLVLAKLTGRLGDQMAVEKLCASLGQVYVEFLPDLLKGEIDAEVAVSYAGCQSGGVHDLVKGLAPNVALVDGELRNWSPYFVVGCGAGFILTLMERMLGAIPDMIGEPALRPLSGMELDLSVMIFEKIGQVLRSAVNAPGGFEPLLHAPHNIEERRPPTEDEPNEFAAAIRLAIKLGVVTSYITLIVPQKVLLKTEVVAPKPKATAIRSEAFTQQITQQVHRSQVTLDARIQLEALTLDTISRLAVGDVIPFMDSSDVHVEVSANGKDLYVCEFGRSGENYTVRVKDNINSDDELLRHLMN